MTTLSNHISTMVNKAANYIGHMVLRALLIVVVAGVCMAVGNSMGMQVGETTTVSAPSTQGPSVDTPVETPAPAACELAPKGLFNPCATLDPGTVDDLRGDPESQCIAADGVITPERTCVDAISLWQDEVDPSVWAELRAAGYPRDIDHSDGNATALRVPAEFVILGGSDGETVLAVDMARPLTPRLLG